MTKRQRKVEVLKFKMPKLTEEERILIAEQLDSPLMKLLAEKIIPARATQLALTCVSAAMTEQDLWFYKGRVAEADWLPGYLNRQVEGIDDTDVNYENGDDEQGEIGALDDNPNRP